MTSRYKYCDHCGARLELGEKCTPCSEARLKRKRKSKREYQQTFYNENKETQKDIKSKRWQKFRRLIIQRDKGICQRCYALKDILVSDSLEVHHIKPRVKYPELMFEETNAITICKTCNTQLGIQEELDFEPLIDMDNQQVDTFHL